MKGIGKVALVVALLLGVSMAFSIGSSFNAGGGGGDKPGGFGLGSNLNINPKDSGKGAGMGSSVNAGDNGNGGGGVGSNLDVNTKGFGIDSSVNAGSDSNDKGFGIGSSIGVNQKAAHKKKPAVHCGFPNGTATHLKVFDCDPSLPLQITSLKVVNAKTNATIYPLRLGPPIAIDLKLFNHGDVIETDNLNITLSEYGPGDDGKCVFNELPTSGALENLDGCDLAHDCPIPQGESSARIPFHLDQFSDVIGQLKRNKVYQLEINILDSAQDEPTKVGCIITQGRVI